MALQTYHLEGRCAVARPACKSHWHHTCWNCEADVCGGTIEYGSSDAYTCRTCGCGETSHMYLQTDASYDPELAAALSCP